jgi:hypothetical protein
MAKTEEYNNDQMSNRSVWSTRHTFHNGNSAPQPSKGVNDNVVQALLAQIRGLRDTTDKMTAVRSSNANIAAVEALNTCYKSVSSTMQPLRSSPQPTSQAAVAEVNQPSFALR